MMDLFFKTWSEAFENWFSPSFDSMKWKKSMNSKKICSRTFFQDGGIENENNAVSFNQKSFSFLDWVPIFHLTPFVVSGDIRDSCRLTEDKDVKEFSNSWERLNRWICSHALLFNLVSRKFLRSRTYLVHEWNVFLCQVFLPPSTIVSSHLKKSSGMQFTKTWSS